MAKNQKTTGSLKDVAIVIPTYKRGRLAWDLARQIRQFHKDVEIIIVEQMGNEKQNKELAKNLQVKYFNLQEANTAKAKNVGWQETKREIVIFFDDDVEITPETIRAHQQVYQDEQVVGVAGRVINDGEKIPTKTNVETGKTNLLATKFVYRFWSTKRQEVDFVYGCNMSFRRSVLEKVGGFDEKYPKIFEEVDLSGKVKKMGKIIFNPKAMVYHHKAPSGGTRTAKIDKKKMLYRYYGLYIAKNVMFPLSMVTLCLRLGTILKRERRIELIKALLRGFLVSIV